MRYHFYTTSATAWAGMLAGITSAERSIYLEMYIFQDDTKGYDFLSLLERKARAGIRVVVILDAIGSFGLAGRVIDRLRSAGAEVLFFSYWFRRTHRKILIIDEQTIFLGGVNISDRFAPWKDLQVRLSGKILARHALRSFARAYRECGGKNALVLHIARPPLLKKARLWFIEHGLDTKRSLLRAHYEKHIDNATESIALVTPYFVPPRWLIARLHGAIMRGVSVSLLIPQHTDYPIVDRINAHYLALFTKLGAVGYLGAEMNHAKAMLIDLREGVVGSHNIDPLSFDWNVETSIFFDNEKMVRDLAQIIDLWKQSAKLFDPTQEKTKWYDIFITILLRIFQPIL